MAKGQFLSPELIINGSFGEAVGFQIDPNTGAITNNEVTFLADIQEIRGTISKSYGDVYPSGTRHMKHKLLGVSGEGTIRKFKVTSDWLRLVANVFHTREGTGVDSVGNKHHNVDHKLSLIVSVDDPEAIGAEQIRVLGVKFSEINFGWQVNEMVEESVPFTFEEIELIQKITGSAFDDLVAQRYAGQRNI